MPTSPAGRGASAGASEDVQILRDPDDSGNVFAGLGKHSSSERSGLAVRFST
jgi:hypothetical protein